MVNFVNDKSETSHITACMPIYMFIVMYALYIKWMPTKSMICVQQHQPKGF
jgi:hypothetical protein